MFRIVIVGWNVGNYIERCIKSVIDQDCTDWTACIVLDPSPDDSFNKACEISKDDHRIKVILNSEQMFATANIIRSIAEQPNEDEDIIITIDGDDWLSGNDTLTILKSYYTKQPNLLVTHGSWVSYPNPSANTNNSPYSIDDWHKGIRRVNWRASHLRTFKYKVWKHVDKDDLIGPDNLYARVAWDLAIMYPMLEMAGCERVKFIPEILYVYNQESPYNDGKMRLREQMLFADFFAAKPPYQYKEVL